MASTFTTGFYTGLHIDFNRYLSANNRNAPTKRTLLLVFLEVPPHAVLLKGMKDVKNKKCNHPGCNVIPSFGFPPDGKPTRCAVLRSLDSRCPRIGPEFHAVLDRSYYKVKFSIKVVVFSKSHVDSTLYMYI